MQHSKNEDVANLITHEEDVVVLAPRDSKVLAVIKHGLLECIPLGEGFEVVI